MRNSWIWTAVLAVLWTSCSQPEAENPTQVFAPAKRMTELKNKKLKEVSGMIASHGNPGMFWVHNDSGNDPEVYLVDTSLEIRMTCQVGEVENRDWEDIAIGPGPEPGKSYIYLGDIGDNESQYEYKYIYRFEEPRLREGAVKITLNSFDTFTFRLEGKRKDTETLIIDPHSKNLYIISKREQPVWLYELRYPQSLKDTLVAAKVASLPFKQIVAGDVRPDGKQILLKNYEHVYYWRSDDAVSVAELLQEAHFEVPYEVESQGEAIAWASDHSGFYTLGEKNAWKETYLFFYKDQSDEADAQGSD